MDRAIATAKLERIVQSVEAGHFPAQVKELYVFGSYARGAPNPGDLDVIVVHEPPSTKLLDRLTAEIIKRYGEHSILEIAASWPHRKFKVMMRKVIQKPGEKMDILLATSLDEALKGRSTIASSKRVLIWSESDQDWCAKINSIKLDASAGRYKRGHFADLRRFHGGVEMMETVSKLVAKRVLRLTRIEADAVMTDLNAEYQYWHEHWVRCKAMGKDSMKLLMHGMCWMQQQRGQMWKRPHAPTHDSVMDSQNFKYAVYFGKPPLHAVHGVARKEHRRIRICLIPHFKRGQSNEMFVFERGSKWSQSRFDAVWRK